MDASEMDADLAEMIGENETNFTWINPQNVQQEYRGAFSPEVVGNTLGVGGFNEDKSATLYCRLATLTAGTPTVGNALRINAQWWRVVRIDLDDSRVGVVFTLESADR